jgi:hypothetical protein
MGSVTNNMMWIQISITKTTGALVQAAHYFQGKSVAFCVPRMEAILTVLIN